MTSEDGDNPFARVSSDHKTGDTRSHIPAPKSKFRFKDQNRSKRKSDERYRSPSEPSERERRSHDRERRHRDHRSKRHKHSSSTKDDPSLYDDTHLPNTSFNQYKRPDDLDPDIAFRESLFDAMADDEGAQFWEGVYGQPIHQYPNVKKSPDGELERMTDEEYTAFVRAKMYEKTHQHLIEEKAKRDAAKKERDRLAKEAAKEEQEAQRFRRKVEESLKRGEERKTRKTWTEKWDAYTQKWETLGKGGVKVALGTIPWPVESGRRKDIDLKEVERFFLYAPTAGQPTESQLGKVLKAERVRWHPDKIQQKLGGQDVSEDVMQAVTAVFQVIDRMWSELREAQK